MNKSYIDKTSLTTVEEASLLYVKKSQRLHIHVFLAMNM